jgi:hypothetical protein
VSSARPPRTGFAGREFAQNIARLDAQLVRPDRKRERRRFGLLGAIRQWIESINDTLKRRRSLEAHGGHAPDGVWVRRSNGIGHLQAQS